MAQAFGIVSFAGNNIRVGEMQNYRPVGAVSFLGRYRVIDFPISNMSNSEIEHIQVYVRRKPRSLTEHLGTGRHYNINSKSGRLHILYSDFANAEWSVYNNDLAAYEENMECIEAVKYPYDELLKTHIESGADITLLYHSVDNAKEYYLNCSTLNLNKQKGVLSLEPNHGNAKNRNIFMDTYVMRKDLFMELVKKGRKISSMFTLNDIVNMACSELDVRGVSHRGFFASITDFKSYYNANLSLIDMKNAVTLFDKNWPIYTRTNDSCPTKYYEGASVKSSVISNGCLIEGTVENSVIGRGCVIKKGAVVKDSVILPGVVIGEDARIADPEKPGYVRRNDTL